MCSACRASCARPRLDEGKKAELIVEGASGELDRQVLERMLPPFEHLLRNAVVHGIEKPEARLRGRQARDRPDPPGSCAARAPRSSSTCATMAPA